MAGVMLYHAGQGAKYFESVDQHDIEALQAGGWYSSLNRARRVASEAKTEAKRTPEDRYARECYLKAKTRDK